MLCWLAFQVRAAEVPGPQAQFVTGGNGALQLTNFVGAVPQGVPGASFLFEFDFGTAETPASAEFFDSFSLTLRTADKTLVEPVVTTDVFGAQWLPELPGRPRTLGQFQIREVASLLPITLFPVRFAYQVVVELPESLVGKTLQWVAGFFDNQDPQASRAVLRQSSVGPSLNMPIELESSTSGAGPYTHEIGAVNDPFSRTLTLPGRGMARFYRLVAEYPTKIASITHLGDVLVLKFQLADPGSNVVVEAAPVVTGPYSPFPAARVDLSRAEVRVGLRDANQFLKLRGTPPVVTTGVRVEGGDLVIAFSWLPPVPPAVESTGTPGEPFAREHQVEVLPELLEVHVRRIPEARFFRLRSETRLLIRRTEVIGGDLILHYDFPDATPAAP